MKRLSEKLQADAAQIVSNAGLTGLQASHMSVFDCLEQDGELTISELVTRIGFSQPAITRTVNSMVKLGYVDERKHPTDQRAKIVSLTPAGRAMTTHLRINVWPQIANAAENACQGLSCDLPRELDLLEAAISQNSLPERAAQTSDIEIVPFVDALARDFYDINEEWVSSMFRMEENDELILRNPKSLIIENDGEIWFVKDKSVGVIGTVALIKIEDGIYELTKMGVRETARGKKAGEKLLAHVINRAVELEMKRLYLLTNSKCEAAIHLYEKLGFVHDAQIMEEYGSRYERCNVAMSYPL